MEILNYINGEWVKPSVKEYFDVLNPATGEVLAKTPLSGAADVDAAAQAASAAFPVSRSATWAPLKSATRPFHLGLKSSAQETSFGFFWITSALRSPIFRRRSRSSATRSDSTSRWKAC